MKKYYESASILSYFNEIIFEKYVEKPRSIFSRKVYGIYRNKNKIGIQNVDLKHNKNLIFEIFIEIGKSKEITLINTETKSFIKSNISLIDDNFRQNSIYSEQFLHILKSKYIHKPIIGLPFKAGSSLINYSYESNVDCIALDWTVNLNWAKQNLNSSVAIQGNLDPISLTSLNTDYVEQNVLSILDIMKDNKFIFSVGHGLTPNCKIKNVRKVIDIVRNYK